MGKKFKQVSAFSLEGRFLQFELEDGYKIKRLNLATADGEVCIKLSKEARASVQGVLTPGDWIWVFGEQYTDPETEVVKYKAYLIKQATPGQTPALSAPESVAEQPKAKAKPQATILVCQKSDCMKRGGKAVCQRLQQELSDRGLTDQVTIKGVGCMKDCKAGPNLVVMPDKARYSRIKAPEIPNLLDEHFPQQQPQPSPSFLSL
ncbi:MAG: (2Fe-2S) ferredoxin domain-containing protein [Leptolyngbyaceae cyanobacterium bins.302]|nr:(2Fe-2S) ferredoxin domain-containing protein [Leptolyngbyaceae cyanobacterium bins.302]